MIKVKSSNIDSIGFEDEVLTVKFKNNTMYNYSDVSEELFEKFKKAESVGKYFFKYIKGKYEFSKVEGE